MSNVKTSGRLFSNLYGLFRKHELIRVAEVSKIHKKGTSYRNGQKFLSTYIKASDLLWFRSRLKIAPESIL